RRPGGVVAAATGNSVRERRVDLGANQNFFDTCVLVPDFTFEPEHAEIVATDQIGIPSDVMPDRVGAIDVDQRIRVSVIRIFEDHSTGLDPYVRTVVASNGWCGECRRGKGNRNGEFAHTESPIRATPDWSDL